MHNQDAAGGPILFAFVRKGGQVLSGKAQSTSASKSRAASGAGLLLPVERRIIFGGSFLVRKFCEAVLRLRTRASLPTWFVTVSSNLARAGRSRLHIRRRIPRETLQH